MKTCLSLAFAILALAHPVLGLSAQTSHQRINLGLTIPDQGSVRYVIDDLTPLTANQLSLKIEIEHPRASDLMVMLLSQEGKYALLPLTETAEEGHWMVVADSSNLLADFIGENAFGRFEVQVYDQVKGANGMVKSIHFTIDGNRPLLANPSGSAVVTGANCSEKWNNLIVARDFTGTYKTVTFQCDQELLSSLFSMVKNHNSLTYERVRKLMFTSLDNVDGKVCSVYSERCIATRDIPSNEVMNCEHTWPQSLGAVGDAQTDLHHLFPAISKENSDRSSLPFCEVTQAREATIGRVGTSTQGVQCYEPPDKHKGEVARAMFYFALRYQKKIDTAQEETFRKWNHLDPVSTTEMMRNQTIATIQGKTNPFVDHPELVDLILDF